MSSYLDESLKEGKQSEKYGDRRREEEERIGEEEGKMSE